MRRGVRGRLLILAAVLLISIYFFLPSTPLYDQLPEGFRPYLPERGVILGLDLQGGMHLVLEVEEEKAVENFMDRMVGGVQEFLKEKDYEFEKVERSGQSEMVVRRLSFDKQEEISDDIKDNFRDLIPKAEDSPDLFFYLRIGEVSRIKTSAISQALETIRNRIDEFGVTEPLIQRQGDREIVIQLPGVKDPERALALIGKTALLEFKLLDEEDPVWRSFPPSVSQEEEVSFMEEFASKVPEADEVLFERSVDDVTGKVIRKPYLIRKNTLMIGDMLNNAQVRIGDYNEPYVSITFNRTGARLFEKITTDNVGKRIAVVLDRNIYMALVINEPIAGGQAQISGRFSTEEASDLAIILRAGALPAPVKIIQNLTVGPSLGRDSIEKGMRATVIAGILVIIFMIAYYRLSGVIANVALIMNLTVLVGSLAVLNATLTLPGIAGIILTIGMGVDSNVLIFERIREELRSGKPIRLSVDSGYDKALVTIIDSHVTTLITAVVLFLFGTGPIKGFAVTLSLGIMINLFTALVGTKVVFDFINGRWKVKRLSI